MTTAITSWFLQSIDFEQGPRSLVELEQQFKPRAIDGVRLRDEPKWEPILRGEEQAGPRGWVTLHELAATRRGIATGSNSFFLISQREAEVAAISTSHLKPCVGRARDVKHTVFNSQDFERLKAAGGKCLLIDFRNELSESDRAYITAGEASGLKKRFLLAARTPWYSMEQRPPAPIWASVFGRGQLEFVYNEARVKSLTNFHCVLPRIHSTTFEKALVALLNSSAVRERSMLFSRGFGGGLKKFEPRDLLGIPVPDLTLADGTLLDGLAASLDELDSALRQGRPADKVQTKIDDLVGAIPEAEQAVENQGTLF